jgi:hypothetical protein
MQDKRRWLPSWQRVELAEKVVLEAGRIERRRLGGMFRSRLFRSGLGVGERPALRNCTRVRGRRAGPARRIASRCSLARRFTSVSVRSGHALRGVRG